MASIYGIRLRNLKTFTGMEGTGFSASLYLDRKKVGTVSDIANGGSMEYVWTKYEDRDAFDRRVDQYWKKYRLYDTVEIFKMGREKAWEAFKSDTLPVQNDRFGIMPFEDSFINELIGLIQDEREYKRKSRLGCQKLIRLTRFMLHDDEGLYDKQIGRDMYYYNQSLKAVLKKADGMMVPYKYRYYRGLSDFDIKMEN